MKYVLGQKKSRSVTGGPELCGQGTVLGVSWEERLRPASGRIPSAVTWEVCDFSGVKDSRCGTESDTACVAGVAAQSWQPHLLQKLLCCAGWCCSTGDFCAE